MMMVIQTHCSSTWPEHESSKLDIFSDRGWFTLPLCPDFLIFLL
jgi:hypothetical protein